MEKKTRPIGAVLVLAVLLALFTSCCVDEESGWQVGNEIRLTDDPEPNLDPFWFHYEGNLDDLSGCKICFHDGSNIKVYDFDTESIQIVQSVPVGYEITALQDIRGAVSPEDYIYTLFANDEVIINAVFDGIEVEVFRDVGERIDGILAFYDSNGILKLIIERDNKIYYYQDDAPIYLCEGFNVHYDTDLTDLQDLFLEICFTFARGSDSTSDLIHGIYIPEFSDFSVLTLLSDLNYNQFPSPGAENSDVIKPFYYVSDRNGNPDIWILNENVQVTDSSSQESSLETYDEHVVYSKEVDEQIDLFRVRCRGPELQF